MCGVCPRLRSKHPSAAGDSAALQISFQLQLPKKRYSKLRNCHSKQKKKNKKSPRPLFKKYFLILLPRFAFRLRFDLSGLLLKIVTNEKLKQLSPICIRKNSPWCMKLNSIAFLLLMQLLSARGRQEKICERKYNVYKLDWHKCSSHFLPAA